VSINEHIHLESTYGANGATDKTDNKQMKSNQENTAPSIICYSLMWWSCRLNTLSTHPIHNTAIHKYGAQIKEEAIFLSLTLQRFFSAPALTKPPTGTNTYSSGSPRVEREKRLLSVNTLQCLLLFAAYRTLLPQALHFSFGKKEGQRKDTTSCGGTLLESFVR